LLEAVQPSPLLKALTSENTHAGSDRVIPINQGGKATMDIQPGTKVIIANDILVNNQIVFSKGEEVVVEDTSPNPKQPDYKYVVFSEKLGTRYQLRNADIVLIAERPQPHQQPPVPTEMKTTSYPPQQPKDKKKTALIIAGVIIVILIIVIVVMAVSHKNSTEPKTNNTIEETTPVVETTEPTTTPQSTTPPPAPVNPPKISLAEYEQIQKGMTYEQAVSIIGGPGEVMTEADTEGLHIIYYKWNGEGLGAQGILTFHNDILVSKVQSGLK
jgi:hypothetical protein